MSADPHDPHEADYVAGVHCPMCGFPRSAHRAVWDRIDDFGDELRLAAALADHPLLMRLPIPPGWFAECERLMQAEAAMIAAEAAAQESEEREARRAERANRAWEQGLL